MEKKSDFKVLVVDDESGIRRGLESLFRRKYFVSTAENGKQALGLIQEQGPYHLLVVDLRMPVMDGETFIRTIRESGDNSSAIIVLTGHGGQDDALDLLEKYAIADFLTKPIRSKWQLLFAAKRAIEWQAGKNALEKLVASRTHDLEQALQSSHVSNEAKKVFLGNLSHEFRTPMNAVLGFLELSISAESVPPTVREMLTEAQGSAYKLLRILENVLESSKLMDGDMRLSAEFYNVQDVLQQAVEAHTAAIHKKGLHLELDVDPDMALQRIGDSPRLLQIVSSLLENAIKFTESGRVSVNVKGDTNTLVVAISDEGIGMTDEQLENLWTPFSQADDSENRRFGGIGIGLTISRQLVELMGGSIQAQSDGLGKGSSFYFNIAAPIANTS